MISLKQSLRRQNSKKKNVLGSEFNMGNVNKL